MTTPTLTRRQAQLLLDYSQSSEFGTPSDLRSTDSIRERLKKAGITGTHRELLELADLAAEQFPEEV